MPIAKHWAFTIWPGNLLGDIKTIVGWYEAAQGWTQGVKYMVFQMEIAPNTGAEHIQGFVSFAGKKRESTLANQFGKVSRECFQVMKKGATPWDNKLYCTKEDSRKPGTVPFEFGQVPAPAGDKEEKSKLDAFIELMKSTTLEHAIETMPSTYVRNCNGLRDLWTRILRSRAPVERHVDIVVCYGNAGSGKSRFANAYDTQANTFKFPALRAKERLNLDGYQGQRTVVIDDYNGQIDYDTFKLLTDRYVYDFNTKGGTVAGLWTTMIITSNQHPNRWYPADIDSWGTKGMVNQSPLQRRYTTIWNFVGVLEDNGNGVMIHDYDNSISCDWKDLPKWVDANAIEAPPAVVPPAAVPDWKEGELEDILLHLARPLSREPTPDPSPFNFETDSETERYLNGEDGDAEPITGINLFD